jgi:coenzyme PQQ precursor peptide PqqA
MDRRAECGKHAEANLGDMQMTWTTPRVIEVSVGMEINCYACADF